MGAHAQCTVHTRCSHVLLWVEVTDTKHVLQKNVVTNKMLCVVSITARVYNEDDVGVE